MNKINIDAFNTLEELSYYDMDDNDVVSTVDAIYCMRGLLTEIHNLLLVNSKEDIVEFLEKIKNK